MRFHVQRGQVQEGLLYIEDQCIMGNGYMGTFPLVGENGWQTDITGNITFPQFCWRAVKRDLEISDIMFGHTQTYLL